jgi:hypothetical protein
MPVIENNLFRLKERCFALFSAANPRPVIILLPETVILLSPVIRTRGTRDEDECFGFLRLYDALKALRSPRASPPVTVNIY